MNLPSSLEEFEFELIVELIIFITINLEKVFFFLIDSADLSAYIYIYIYIYVCMYVSIKYIDSIFFKIAL